MNLLESFALRPHELVALVGGGGKTSLLFALGQAGWPAVLTTTTRLFAAQQAQAVAVCPAENEARLLALVAEHGSCLAVGPVAGDKVLGVARERPLHFLSLPGIQWVVVEADGSRMRPIKAPADHEPAMPLGVTLVIPVVGLDALDHPLAEIAHRPELVSQLTGVELTETLTPTAVAALLTHVQGGLKHVPDTARVIPLLNKVETAVQWAQAAVIAQQVLRSDRIQQVVLGALRTAQPIRGVARRVTAVVLAAGSARRMGQTKQSLPWGDTTVLGQTLRHLQAAWVHEVVVVTGHDQPTVEAIAHATHIPTVFNPDYAHGEMLSSLQTAVRALAPAIEAVLVVLADQPMVETAVYNALLTAFWQTHATLIAPTCNGQRGNPVLISRAHFAELLTLPPDAAPRTLLQRHADSLHLLPLDTDTILQDLDTPEAYAQYRPTTD